MKAPIKNIPPELNRRLDDLENVSAEVDINVIIQAVLAQIVIPEAKFPEGLNQQFLIYKAGTEGWLPSYIDDLRVRGALFVNSDYVTGDEDATIYFNDDNESLIFDYGNDRFEFSKGIYSPNDIETDGNVHVDKAGDNNFAYLYFRAGAEYLVWDNSNTRFQFSDEVFINATYLWIGPATSGDRYLSFQDNVGFHSLYWRTAGYYEFTGGNPLYLTGTDLRINSDYTSGDYDCTIYFNATNNSLKFDYGNDRFEFDGNLYIAGTLETTGLITTVGILHQRPEIQLEEIRKVAKPDSVYIGVFYGYSLPIYAADNEEIFYYETAPRRWDGASDITIHLHVCLADAEDVNDTFKTQVSWEHHVEGEPIPVTSHDVEVQQSVLTDRNAQYDEYTLNFTIDYDVHGGGNELQPGEHWAFRVRRIASAGTEVDNEIIVLDATATYSIDKVFGSA